MNCGMATVCVLIGSFNNHPKWQTIGWIKYTCWLNYRCNVFTPTSLTHSYPSLLYFRHFAPIIEECVRIWMYVSWMLCAFFSVCSQCFSLKFKVFGSFMKWEVKKAERERWRDMETMSHTRNIVASSRNWLSWPLIPIASVCLIEEVGSTDGAFYSQRYVWVCMFCVCKFCLHFNQTKTTMYSIYFRHSCRVLHLCVCIVNSQSLFLSMYFFFMYICALSLAWFSFSVFALATKCSHNVHIPQNLMETHIERYYICLELILSWK